MSKCAILGGKPVREKAIPWVGTMGKEEKEAVLEVMDTGVLSDFLANSGDKFLGGKKVKELEAAFAERFHSRHAISVNSATTALHTAVAACGIGPGDEVLVSPYTMVASASAILMNGGIPVFVDIDENTYTMNPSLIERWITPRTKAILTVNIFGFPGYLKEIRAIADKHGLLLIEDNAQAPGATVNGTEAGTIGDIGIFSLNYHKIIQSGEGGVLVTDSDELAWKCQLIRNHGEVALDELNDMETAVLGNNYRMSELHAAIGIEQLKKLDLFLESRRMLAARLSKALKEIRGLTGVFLPEGYTHSYYLYPIKFDRNEWKISRKLFADAVSAEGFPLGVGYVKPIYLMNLYRHKHIINEKSTFPFSMVDKLTQEYQKGLCPVVERMHYEELVTADVCRLPYTENDIDDFVEALEKVRSAQDELSGLGD